MNNGSLEMNQRGVNRAHLSARSLSQNTEARDLDRPGTTSAGPAPDRTWGDHRRPFGTLRTQRGCPDHG